MRDMLGNLKQIVRRHPTSFLVAAAAAGFFLGSAIRRKGCATGGIAVSSA